MISRDDLLDLVVCPACQAPLASFARCDACGAGDGEADGTPAPIPAAAADGGVSFGFAAGRSVAGAAFRRCFSYPPRRGPSGPAGPYHLDLAHRDVLDQLPRSSTVLEIGCGGGQMRQYL